MKSLTDEIIDLNFEQIYDLELIYDRLVGLKVHLNNVEYEFLLDLRENSDELIVIGTDNLNKDFDYKSWKFKQSTIFYKDPTTSIDESITTGWAIGTEKDYYMENIIRIVEILIEKLDILKNNVLFYGISEYAFMSLLLATYIQDSMVLADIPQFYLSNTDTLANVKNKSFPQITDKEFADEYRNRLDVIEVIKQEKYVPNAYLILDCSVEEDYNSQYLQFFADLTQIPFDKDSNQIKIIANGKNLGHEALDKAQTTNLINNIFYNNSGIKDFEDEFKSRYIESYRLSDLNNIFNLLDKYNTARMDIKFKGEDTKLDIIDISEFTNLKRPSWLNSSGGEGIVLTNHNNFMDVKFKCVGDGTLSVRLRGIDYRDKYKNRVPIYINFTKLLINGYEEMEPDTLTWHDKPYVQEKNVKDGDIIHIHVEWTPC